MTGVATNDSELAVPSAGGRAGEPSPSPRATRSFRRWLLVIALASLLLRWGWVAVAKTDLLESLGVANADCVVPGEAPPAEGPPEHCNEPAMGDAIYYSAQSVWIAEGRWFTHPTEVGPDGEPAEAADHAPLTALVLVPASAVGGSDPLLEQRLLMSLYGVGVVVALGLLGRRVAGDRAGLLAAGLAAVNPNLWMNDVLPMSETLAALGVSVILLLVYRFRDKPSVANAAWVGLAAGITVLARAELGMLLPLVVWPVCWWARSLTPGARVGRAALAALVAVAVAAPWTLYNLSRFDEPVLFSTNDGLTLIGANCDNTYGDGVGFWNLNCAFAVATPPGADQSVRSKIYRDAALTYIGDHLEELPRVTLIRLGRVWGVYPPHQMVYLNTGEGRETGASWAGFVAWWLMAPLAVAGAWILHRRRQMIWPFVACAIAVCVTAVLFYGIVRFRLPADVAACVLAGVAIDAALLRSRAAADAAGTTTDVLPDKAADPSTEAATHAEFPCLDGYRAIGMTLVLVFHAAFATGYDKRSPGLGRYLARMDVGVAMFFVLSAFLLYRPMARAVLHGRDPGAAPRFWRRRALRIFPAYWAALLLIPLAGAVGLTPGLPSADAGEWFINVFLLQGFGLRAPYLITQAWAIGVEAGFYLVLPLYGLWCARRLRDRPADAQVRWMLGGVAAWYVVGQALRAYVGFVEPSWGAQSLLWMPMYADLFAIGMGLAVLSAAASTGRDLPAWLIALSRHPILCWVGAGVAFVAIAQVDPPDVPFTINGGELVVRQFAYGVVALLWLIPGFFGEFSDGRIRGALRSRPLVALGTISLSFYLWHIAFIDQAKAWTIPGYDQLAGLATFQGSLPKVVVIAFVCSAITAALLYRAVEHPFLRLKDEPVWAVGRRIRARVGRPSGDDDPPHHSTADPSVPPSDGGRDHAGAST